MPILKPLKCYYCTCLHHTSWAVPSRHLLLSVTKNLPSTHLFKFFPSLLKVMPSSHCHLNTGKRFPWSTLSMPFMILYPSSRSPLYDIPGNASFPNLSIWLIPTNQGSTLVNIFCTHPKAFTFFLWWGKRNHTRYSKYWSGHWLDIWKAFSVGKHVWSIEGGMQGADHLLSFKTSFPVN